jgi:hypothetical protein
MATPSAATTRTTVVGVATNLGSLPSGFGSELFTQHSPSRQAWRRPTCYSLSLPALADIGKPPLTASHLRARGVLSRKSLKST